MQTPLPAPGLFRTRLAGCSAPTREAFAALRDSRWHMPAQGPAGRAQHLLYGGRIPVSDDPAEGSWEMLRLRDGIFVNTSDCHYRHERRETVRAERFVELHFVLAGTTQLQLASQPHTARGITIGQPCLSIVQQHEGAQYTVACGRGAWRSVGLHVERAWFEDFVRACVPHDSPLLQALHPQDDLPGGVACLQMPLGMGVLQNVEQLLANPYEGHRRLVYAGAKVHEILCATLDLWEKHAAHDDAANQFTARDLRRVAQAHTLLLADPSQVPTIAQLAAAVGTNTSKLKRGFKHLYGTTIFECGHRFRMQHALQLLAEERLPVSDVALAVGYRYQTSFTVSFRAFFGVAPRDARRMVSAATPPVPGFPKVPISMEPGAIQRCVAH